jgi:hypothetical protein
MTTTTDDRGRNNMFAREPQMYIDPNADTTMSHNEKAEILNGRIAMIGVIAALLNYASTGQIIPGLW